MDTKQKLLKEIDLEDVAKLYINELTQKVDKIIYDFLYKYLPSFDGILTEDYIKDNDIVLNVDYDVMKNPTYYIEVNRICLEVKICHELNIQDLHSNTYITYKEYLK